MKDLKEVEKILKKRLAALTKRMEDIDDSLGASSDDDFEEMATESENDEMLDALGHASEEEVRQITIAIDRVRNGTYGKCASCGCVIPEERLDAIPYAVRCIDCAR
jgi:RNA polymerase-binding transcription factor DksA